MKMMMSETLYIVLAFLGGILLGIVFFGGLWFTVKKAVASKIPGLWVLISFAFRVCIVLVGFYFISLGNWKKLGISMTGFIIARFIVIHYTKSIDEKKVELMKEADHEA